MNTSFFVRGRASATRELERSIGAALRPRSLDETVEAPAPRIDGEERSPYVLLGLERAEEEEQVYRARDADLGREVELRVLGAEAASSAPQRERFAGEALLASQVQHPCAGAVYELGEERSGLPFVAVELVRGESLGELLEGAARAPLPLDAALAILEQVAHAVAAAHARGIAHGALGAERIRVGRFGEVKVLGWERGRRFDPAELLPEAKVEDLQALGVLLDACGALGDAPLAPEPRRADPELAEIAERYCALRAGIVQGARPASATRFAEEIAGWLARADARVREAELAAERAAIAARGARKRRLLGASIAAVLVLGAVVGGGAFTWYAHREREREERARLEVEPRVHEALEAVARARASSAEVLSTWERAETVVRNAEVLARARFAPAELREQIAALGREIERALELERAAVALRAEQQRWIEELHRVRVETASTWDFEGADRRFEEIFERLGCGSSLSFERRVERMRGSGLAAQLVEALDAWWDVRRTISLERAEGLIELAIAIDPDPVRRDLRRALPKRGALVAFAKEHDWTSFAPSTLVLLARALSMHAESALTVEVLQRAVERHPRDLWLRIDLSAAAIEDLMPPRTDLALRHGWAATAIDPRCSGAVNRLALAYCEAREPERAVALLSRSFDAGDRSLGTLLNLTVALTDHGAHEAAEHIARDGLALFPHSVELRVNLSSALSHLGKVEDALALLREALALEPTHEHAHNSLGAIQSNALGLFEEATSSFLDALASNPRSLPAHFNLAVVAKRRGDPQEAADWARRGLAHYPHEPTLHRMLGEVEYELGNHEEAEPHLLRALEEHPPKAFAVSALAEIRLRQGRDEDARRLFARASALEDVNAIWALRRLAELQERSGEIEPAFDTLNRGLERFPQSSALHVARGKLLEHQKNLEEALAEYLRGVELERAHANMDHLHAVLLASGILVDLQRFEEAREVLDEGEDHSAHNPNTWTLLAQNRNAARDPEGAARLLERAIREGTTLPRAWWLLAQLRVQSQKTAEALPLIEAGLAKFPDDRELQHRLGFLLLTHLDQPEQAAVALARAAELEPNAECSFYLGVARDRSGDLDGAIDAWRRAAELSPRMLEAHTNLGFGCLRLQRLEAARSVLERALEIDGAHLTALNNLGLVLWELGELSAAAEKFESCVEKATTDSKAWLSLGQISIALGRYRRAREALDRCAELGIPRDVEQEVQSELKNLEELESWSSAWPRIVTEPAAVPTEPRARLALAYVARAHGDARLALELLRELDLERTELRFLAAICACELAAKETDVASREQLYGSALDWLERDVAALAERDVALERKGLEWRRRAPALELLRDPAIVEQAAPSQAERARELALKIDERLRELRLELGDEEPQRAGG